MEINKTVANPLLVGAMQLLKAEDTPEHRKLMLEELSKATLLAPAKLNPEPIQDENGVYKPEDPKAPIQMQFPMLTAKDGNRFFVAFTDNASMMDDGENPQVNTPEEFRKYTVTMRIQDFAKMLVTKDAAGNDCPCVGVVINPFRENVLFNRQMAAAMLGLIKPAQ